MLSKIKPYWSFSVNVMKMNFAYKGSFYLFIVSRVLSCFITYYLWKAVYGSTSSATLGGFDINEITLYVFMSFVVSGFAFVAISDDLGSSIIDGSVSMMLIKPLNYRMVLIFQGLGSMIYRFVVPSVFIWVGVELYRCLYIGLAAPSILNIVLFLASSFLSFLIYVLFDYLVGMLAFFTTYIFGLKIAKSAILGILSGQLIPLSFFPEAMQKVFSFLPFSGMTYYPVIVYMGKGTASDIAIIFLKQIFWVIILYLIGSLIWRKVTKRLVVLGG